jgi:filamentous hemagglutinin family protein
MKNAALPFYKSDNGAHPSRPSLALKPIAYFVMLACCDAALANPNGPQVISGSAQMQGLGTGNLRITNTPGAIINWQGFSIGAGQITQFVQQSGASAVLNRVVGPDISQIQGQLQSNGRVFLINPAGIVVGAGAIIDTAGFVGSTLNMLDADFLAGKLRFQGDATAGSIVNQGYIKTTHGGSVVLVAPRIENSGIIQTDDGRILLAAGRKLTIGSLDANDVQFEVQAPADSVLNVGKLLANGGAVGIFAGTLRHSGDIRANALTRDAAGNVVLEAQGDVTLAAGSHVSADGKSGGAITVQSTGGTTIASGDISAQGSEGKGGDVRVLGERVGIFDAAVIDASGAQGGGKILVGGDYQGRNTQVQNAGQTVVGANATLRADATDDGDGGRVIVWSDGYTRFDGTLNARGAGSGSGGFAETSGKESLNVGDAHVDLTAPGAAPGTWLLDPRDILVQTGGAATQAQANQFSDTPTTDVTISPATLAGGGSSVVLQANNDVTFASAVNLGSSKSLSVQAGRSIFVNANIDANDSSGITLIANETTAAGVLAAQRQTGAATLEMAPGTSITQGAGGGDIVLRMNAGISGDATKTSGDIVLSQVTAGNGSVSVIHSGAAAGGRILRADSSSLVSASGSVFLGLESSAGSTASIGTAAAPVRIDTPILEARNVNGTGGIFIDSTRTAALQIGGTAAAAGGLRGVQAPAGGPVQISAANALNLQTGTAVCGTAGGTGGPVCAGSGSGAASALGLTDTVTLRASDMEFARPVRGRTVTLLPLAGEAIQLNSAAGVGVGFRLSQADITSVDTGLLTAGEAASGAVTFAATGLSVTKPFSIQSGGAITGAGAAGVNDLTVSGALTLSGTSIGTNADEFFITPSSTISATASSGGIFIRHNDPANPMRLSNYTLSVPAGQTLRLNHSGPGTARPTIDTDINLPGVNVVLTGFATFTEVLVENSPTVNAASLLLSGNTTFASGTGTSSFNTPVTITGTTTFTSGTHNFAQAATFQSPVTINGGTANINVDSTITAGAATELTLAGGTLGVGGNQSLTVGAGGNGEMVWSGGTMSGSGTTAVANTLAINAGAAKAFTNHKLTIAGQATWTGNETIASDGGSVTLNGGLDIQGDGVWGAASAGAVATTFNNNNNNAVGVRRSTSTGTAALDNVVFSSTPGPGPGAINVQAGTLRLSRGVAATQSSVPGAVNVSAGATVEFAGANVPVAGAVAGPGTVLVSGGLLDAKGAFTAPLTVTGGTAQFVVNNNPAPAAISVTGGTLTFGVPATTAGATLGTGGTLEISNAGNTLTLTGGTFDWTGGTLTGAGSLVANAGTTVNISGAVDHSFNGSAILDNGGTVNWSAGNIVLGPNGGANQIINRGTFNATSGGSLPSPAVGTFTFDNRAGATFNKSGTGTTTSFATAFDNTGNVNINSGTLQLSGGGTNTGNLTANATGTIDFNAGTYTVTGGTVGGAGSVLFSGATANFDGGTYNVTGATTMSDGSATFAAAATGASLGAFSESGGTFTLNTGDALAATTLNLTGGTLGGSDTINAAGIVTWSAGTMTGSGATNATAGLAITGASTHALANGRTLSVAGGTAATWVGAGGITLGGGAAITVAGTFADNSTDGSVTSSDGTAASFSFSNTYTKSVSGTTTFGPGVAFNNTGGAVNVTAGVLRLSGGGTSTGNFGGGGFIDFDAGTYNLNGGAYGVIGGTTVSGATVTFNAAADVTDVGALTVSGGTLTMNSNEVVPAASLSVSGGTLGGGDTINVAGGTIWSAGTMTGSGTTNANGGLTLSTAGTKTLTLGRTLRNAAGQTASWSGGTLALDDGAQIVNAGTFFDETGDGVISHTGTAASVFTSTGTYTKRNSAGTTVFGVPFDNTGGAVNVTIGAMRLAGGTSTGDFAVNAGSTVDFNSGTYNIDAGNVSGAGTVSISAAGVNVNGGNYNVTGATGVSGGSLTFNAGANLTNVGALSVSNGTLDLDSGEAVAASSLTQSGGAIAGADTLNVAGATAWSGGTMSGAGTTNANGGLTLSGGAKVLGAGRTLTNGAGQTATWSGAGAIQVGNNATIDNRGTFDDQSTGTISQLVAGDAATFDNAGAYTKTGAGTSRIDVAFNNNAATSSLAVNAGTLRFTQGGSSSRAFSVSPGATLEFGSNYALNAGAALGGTGTALVSAGTLSVNAPIAFGGNLQMTGGAIDAAAAITLDGTFDWASGTIQGAGILRTNAATNVTGAVTLTDKQWTNAGTVAMTGASRITLDGNGATATTIVNNGTFTDSSTNASPISQSTTPANKSFVNAGTFTKAAGSTAVQNVDIRFDNSGTLDVDSGRLQLTAGGTHSGALVLPGVLELGGSASVHDFNANTSVTGAGTLVLSGGTLNIAPALATATAFRVAGGTVNDTGGLTLNGVFEWFGGTIGGAGTLTTGAASTSSITGAVALADKTWNNAGSATISGAGSLTLNGAGSNAVNNQSGGSITVTSTNAAPIAAAPGSGTKSFANAGTFNSNPGAGVTSTISLPTSNGGTINVNSGTLALASFPTNAGTSNIDAGAMLSTGGAALANEGTLGGAGTLDLGGAALANNGTLRPGAAAGDTTGTLAITGQLTDGPLSRTEIELGGTAAGDFDVVAVSGGALLTGTMNVSTVGGYTPAVGDVFRVITAGSRTGNFQAVNKTFATPMRAAYAGLAIPGLQFTIGGDNIVNWVAADGDISVPGNWDLGHVPGPGEIARIDDPSGTRGVTIGGTFNPDSLSSNENLTVGGGTLSLAQSSTINANLSVTGGAVQGAGPITVNGGLTFTGGTLASTGGITVTGTTDVNTGAPQITGTLSTGALNVASGTLGLGAGSLLALTGTGASTVATSAALANSGTLRVAGGGSLTVAPGATFTNAGTFDVQNGSATVNGFSSNPGTISVGANSSLTTSAPLFVNSGGLTLGVGSTFSTSGNPLTNASTGTIGGNGTINLGAATLTNNGRLRPGASPGTLAITGNYAQGPAGVLDIELGGLAPGSGYDVVNVSGTAALDGTLNVSNFGSFVPGLGNRFDFMNYASRTGDFAAFNFPANTLLQAQAGAVTYALLGSGTPRDSTADELRRLLDDVQRVSDRETVEEPRFRSGKLICQ